MAWKRISICLECKAVFTVEAFKTGGSYDLPAGAGSLEDWECQIKYCPVCGEKTRRPVELMRET